MPLSGCCSGTKSLQLLAIVGVILPQLHCCLAAVYKVAHNNGKWGADNYFQAGDSLSFADDKDGGDVHEVTWREYKACHTSKPIRTYTKGGSRVAEVDEHSSYLYFISAQMALCRGGRRLMVVVVRASSPAPAPAPTPPAAPPPNATRSTSLTPVPVPSGAPAASLAPPLEAPSPSPSSSSSPSGAPSSSSPAPGSASAPALPPSPPPPVAASTSPPSAPNEAALPLVLSLTFTAVVALAALLILA